MEYLAEPDWKWVRDFGLTVGIHAGDLLHISGIVGFAPDGTIAEGDMYEQSRQVFSNIANILDLNGSSMSRIVRIGCFLSDLSRFQEFSRARKEYFPDRLPANTAVGAALALPTLLVEVEVVAEA